MVTADLNVYYVTYVVIICCATICHQICCCIIRSKSSLPQSIDAAICRPYPYSIDPISTPLATSTPPPKIGHAIIDKAHTEPQKHKMPDKTADSRENPLQPPTEQIDMLAMQSTFAIIDNSESQQID